MVVAQVRRRNTTAMTGDRRDGQGRLTQVERYKLQIPWEEPWDDRMLWEHPAVMALLAQLWGSEDFELTDYSSNCPSPGSEYQQARPLPPAYPLSAQRLSGCAWQWHRDSTPALVDSVSLPVYPNLALRLPLVDTSPENGSVEVVPCTHTLPHTEYSRAHYGSRERPNPSLRLHNLRNRSTAQPIDLQAHLALVAEHLALPVLPVMDRVMESGSFPSKMRLNLPAGSALLIDPRLIHRGTPNTSDHTRLEPSIGYTLSWSVRAPYPR